MILDYLEGFQLFKKYGINVAETIEVKTKDEAIDFAKNKKIVLKLYSEKATHKLRLGLVKLDLSRDEIPIAFDELEKIGKNYSPYKIIAQEMLPPGKEAIIGANEDPDFGKFVIFGLGGSYVEVFKDISSRLCPLTKRDISLMLDEIKAKDIIIPNQKMRGVIINLLYKVSKIVEKEDIKELDMNPTIIYDNSYRVADLRVKI